MLSGDNSILSRAGQARDKTEFAKVQEEIALAQAEAVGNHYLGGSSDTIEAQVLAKLTASGYTIGSENSGTIQGITLSSNETITIEEGGNTAEVTATLNTSEGSTNYVLINGLYYPLNKKANGDIELGETGKKTLENSTVSLSDVTIAPTGAINATLDSSTGKVTITSSNVTADENAIVKLQNNGTDYATINVAVKKASISIPATADVTSGGTTTLTAILAEYQKGTVSWSITPASTSTYASLTGSTTGTSVTVIGGTTIGQKVTIRATYTTGTAPATATADCEVTVKADNHISDKSYVDYNVSYTDVYTGTPYTSDTGWRLLTDLSSYESAGTYTGNIEIISTGIPAKLYYHYDSIQSFENTNPKTVGKWAGDSNQRNTYTSTYYNSSSPYYNIYAAAGLMYNFENIVFNYSGSKDNLTTSNISKEYGGYVAISNGGTAVTASNNITGASLFRVSSLASGSVSGIRSVSLADLTGKTTSDTSFTDKRTGLFTLQNYTPDKHNSGYYWLASPYSSNNYLVHLVNYSGSIYDYYDGTYGLRPVVSISNVKLELHSNVWQIVAK